MARQVLDQKSDSAEVVIAHAFVSGLHNPMKVAEEQCH